MDDELDAMDGVERCSGGETRFLDGREGVSLRCKTSKKRAPSGQAKSRQRLRYIASAFFRPFQRQPDFKDMHMLIIASLLTNSIT